MQTNSHSPFSTDMAVSALFVLAGKIQLHLRLLLQIRNRLFQCHLISGYRMQRFIQQRLIHLIEAVWNVLLPLLVRMMLRWLQHINGFSASFQASWDISRPRW